MTTSLFGMAKLLRLLNNSPYYRRWRVLLFFMLFFLVGYVASFFLVVFNYTEPLLFLTGAIYLFGAMFVAVVIRDGRSTITDLFETSVSKDELEQVVQERTLEIDSIKNNLEVLNDIKSDFINVIAHELRTPLTVIKGYTQVLENHQVLNDDDDTKLLLNGLGVGIERLFETVNLLLDVTRIDSQALEIRQENVSLYNVITNVTSSFQLSLQERQLTLTISNLENLPNIQGDTNLLRKMFYHLVVNAIKYTPDGGKITITCHQFKDAKQQTAVQIAICDTGIGIDPEHHELIFERFYQTGQLNLHSSGKTKFKGGGAGMGLAIVRGIVNAHGGCIWVKSDQHNEEIYPGSCFYVCLPLKAKAKLIVDQEQNQMFLSEQEPAQSNPTGTSV